MQQRRRELTIVAQDPGIKTHGRILRARVNVPAEELGPGPRGARAHVIDYDSATNTLYAAQAAPGTDLWADAPDRMLLDDPGFHAQNVYAIVMRTLARFESALGRRVSWGFGGHQIKIAPHALAAPNAFYSRANEALLFGYFRTKRKNVVHTCLSHDIVAHETAHALLDGIRRHYTEPSTPDQAAFHEGFADLVAVLSVFSLPEVVDVAVPSHGAKGWRLHDSILFSIAKQLGSEIGERTGGALRRSLRIAPRPGLLRSPEFQDPHRRGEVFVAAILNAFLEVWDRRVVALAITERKRVVEEGAQIAEHLLTMAIRALDYSPPTDIRFGDYLSALLTADFESCRGDARHGLRPALIRSFARFGIRPTSRGTAIEPGVWRNPGIELEYKHTHFDAMQRDGNEVFNFLWQNRKRLSLCEEAYTRVESVRPCVRTGPDGFVLRETVAEYVKVLRIRAGELGKLHPSIAKPRGMPAQREVRLLGGGALIFDEYGALKYHVRNALLDPIRQAERLRYLWSSGRMPREKGIDETAQCSHQDVRGGSWRLLSSPL